MFKKSLKIGLVRSISGKRTERRTKPSLESLDVRIALSGVSGVVLPEFIHAPIGSPTPHPLVVTSLAVPMSSPIGIPGGGNAGTGPGHYVPDGGMNR